jgi:hypothetical protein
MIKIPAKTLIAIGDSFTNPQEYKVWPEYIAEKNGWNCINLALQGLSNHHIFNSAIDSIDQHSDKDLVVIAGWSDCYRLNFFDMATGWFDSPDYLHKRYQKKSADNVDDLQNVLDDTAKKLTRVRVLSEVINDQETDLANAFFKVIESSLRQMYLLEEYCNLKGIEFYHFSSLNIMGTEYLLDALTAHNNHRYNETDVLEDGIAKVKESVWYKKLNTSERYLGFDWDSERFVRLNNCTISENDGHPSAVGHKLIADVVHDFIIDKKKIKLEHEIERTMYVYD